MKNLTVSQLKNAMIELYPLKDADSEAAYRLAFDLLESKLSDEKFDQFLDSYGL
jgi:hypothetical protein